VKKAHFLKIVQHRAARVAVTASATRGQGADVVDCARDFLVGLKLARFGTHDPRGFARLLDADTERLRACLPKRAARWGLARKLLNIFLRDSLYTSYLARQYGLVAAERLLEVPLDSITAKRIRREAPALALALPRWRGVRHLDPDRSAAYQEAALVIARQRGIARVHLDADWWGARKSEEAMPTAGGKAASTRRRRAAGRKAAVTRKRRAAGRKAAVTRRRRAAGRKAAAKSQTKARR